MSAAIRTSTLASAVGMAFDRGKAGQRQVHTMAFEEIKAEFSLLFQEMEPQPQDLHELYEMLHEKLNEIRATGMPVPEDLRQLEDRLDAYFTPPGDDNGGSDAGGDGGGE